MVLGRFEEVLGVYELADRVLGISATWVVGDDSCSMHRASRYLSFLAIPKTTVVVHIT